MMGFSKRNHPVKWKRRLRRSLIWTLVFFSIFVLLCVFLLSVFPSQKAGTILSKNLSVVFNRPIQMEHVSFRPWRGLEIQNVEIGIGSKGDTLSMLHFKRVGVQFRWPALLRRRLDVTAVLIENPTLHVVSLPKNRKKDYQKPLPLKTKTLKQPPPPQKLPLSLGLFNLEMKHFSLQLSSSDSTPKTELQLDGIHLDLSGLHVPRDPLESLQDVRGRIHLYTQSGQVSLQSSRTHFEAEIQLQLSARWQKDAKWTANLNLELNTLQQNSTSAIRWQSTFHGQELGEIVHIDTATLSIGLIPLITLEGEIRQLDKNPTFDLKIDGSGVAIEDLIPTAQAFFTTPMTVLNGFTTQGSLHLLKGEMSGNEKSVSLNLKTQLENVNLNLEDAAGFNDVSFSAQFNGKWEKGKDFSGQTKGSIGGSSFSIIHSDTNVVAVNPQFHWEGQFDQSIVPVSGFLRGKSESAGGSFNAALNWKSNKKFFWNAFQCHGDVWLDSVFLAKVPGMPFGVEGIVHTQLNFEAPSLSNIQIHVNTQTDSIQIPQFNDKIPPFHLSSHMTLETDSSFQFWNLKKGNLKADSLFSGLVTGNFISSQQGFQASLSDGRINNNFARGLLASLIPQLKEMKVDGFETLNFEIQGKKKRQGLNFYGNGSLQFEEGKLYWPPQGLFLDGVTGGIHFQGSDENFKGDFRIQVDSCKMESLSPDLLKKSLISCQWGLAGSDSLWLNDIHIAVPSFGIQGAGWGRLLNPEKDPLLTAGMELVVRPENKITLKDSLFLSGMGRVDLTLHQFLLNSQQGRLSGLLSLDGIQIQKQDLFSMRGLRGSLPFSLEGNLKSRQFIKQSDQSSYSSHEYENQQSLYRHTIPSIGRFSFDSVTVAGHTIHSAEMDLDIRSGSIQVPRFHCHVFEGNIGGSLRVTLEGEWKNLSYEIRAQAARIQSAAFLPFAKEKRKGTELNATMAFQGKSIDFKTGVDLDGSFHITKMGPRFASTMLEAMDPQGTDRSIRLTRRLITLGWKPQLFSFELRHGYVYPSLTLSQPWFSPLRIPKNWEYSRLPLAFFIERMFSDK